MDSLGGGVGDFDGRLSTLRLSSARTEGMMTMDV